MNVFDWLKHRMNGKSKGSYKLEAKVTVGTQESADRWSQQLGRTVKVGEVIDLGTISESEAPGWGVQAGG